ncbi:MAG: DUF2288 domain-containing protein [Okeania sp. SIO3B5]|nr:DUF2288 domain-containing protein [Okeania sp. SIO3B5]
MQDIREQLTENLDVAEWNWLCDSLATKLGR